MRHPGPFVPVLALAAVGLSGCGTGGTVHHGHQDHGHLNDGERAGPPAVAVTRWTDRTELLLEYPRFEAGATGRSTIHVTDLVDFSPLAEGQATVVLRSPEGRILEFRAGPSRPGIFRVVLEVERSGTYDMTVRVEGRGLRDVHELGPVTVHPPGKVPAVPKQQDPGIEFGKEQQWALDFGTSPVEVRRLRASRTVPAVVRPRSAGQAVVTAPVPGRIEPVSDVPVPGTTVAAGAALARIVPRSDDLRDAAALRAARVEAEQEHDLAVRDRDRVERLVEARALPSRRLAEARAAVATSEARLRAARERWDRYETLSQTASEVGSGTGAFTVRAPLAGIVHEVRFVPGASVEQNEVLLRLVDPDRVHVVGWVPESSAADLRAVTGGELLVADGPAIVLGRPLSVGRIVEPLARTTEVRFAFDNRRARLPIGAHVGLRLWLGAAEPRAAVPESAVVDDAGGAVVFVQTGGERFERRPVRLGDRAEGWVGVLEGVEAGERVVHRGAYLVRLAALSTETPAHGHVH